MIAHPASCEAWTEQLGVPFQPTLDRAHELASAAFADQGHFEITCLGGILVCRA